MTQSETRFSEGYVEAVAYPQNPCFEAATLFARTEGIVPAPESSHAIKGAIDRVQLGNLTGLLTKIQPAVDATAYQGERSAKNYAFVDAVARKNVELTMAEIHKRSAVIAALEAKGAVKIAGASRGWKPIRLRNRNARPQSMKAAS